MCAHSSAVVLEDRQRGVEGMAKATRRRFTAEYKLRLLRGSRRLPEARGDRLLAEARGIVHLPPVPLAQAGVCKGAQGARLRQTRPGAEGDEPAGGEGGGAGAGDAVAGSPS